MNKHRTIGIDLAKSSFYLVTLSPQGKREGRTKLTRAKLLKFMAQQPVCTVAMEACASSHYWAREIQHFGHRVQLLPAQHVKGYLRGQKNDYNDAQAIAEASQHGAIRPVAIKMNRPSQMRRHLSAERTRLINHVRGLLTAYGLVLKQENGVLRKALPVSWMIRAMI